MNRIGEIIRELTQLSTQKSENEQAIKENMQKGNALVKEWQGLCKHPEEYVDTEEDGSTLCRACNKQLGVTDA